MMKKGIARSKGKKKFQKVIVDFLLVEAENVTVVLVLNNNSFQPKFHNQTQHG